jgi:perosamine synthetase
MTKNIPVCEPLLSARERDYLIEAFDDGWISSGGKFNKRLEDDFSSYCNTNIGITVANGTVALHLALIAIGINPGDQIIIPNFNGIYGAFAICYVGGIPVFVDADNSNWNINPLLIEEKITSKTKAIMVTHMYGHPCDMDPIIRIANKYGLPIIEDAAEAHGATYKNRICGGLGDIGIFSFYANKIITSGEGGIIVTNNEIYAEKCKYYRNQCFSINGPRDFIHENIGYNYRMTNLQCAIAVGQFEQIEKLVFKRKRIKRWYQNYLNDIPGLNFQNEMDWANSVNWMTSITVDPTVAPFNRIDLENYLINNKVETRRLFVGLNRQPALQNLNIDCSGNFPVSNYLSDNGLYLPTSPNLTKHTVEFICSLIKELYYKK